MKIYPDFYLKNILKINNEFIEKNQIKALILDVDNTLIDYEKNLLKGAIQWCEELKRSDIKFCILSNSNKKEKVQNVAKVLDIPYLYFAKKPLKQGFYKAKRILQIEDNSKIGVVGDQIFTDVIGANRVKMKSILVEPINKKDIFITKIKRPIENWIIKKYIKKTEEK